MKPTTRSSIVFHRSAPLLAAALFALMANHAATAATYTWARTAAGTYDWNAATTNWNTAFPNAVADIASLNVNLAGAQTINLNQVITVATINLGDTTTAFFGETIAGNGGSLIMDATGTAAVNISKATAGNTAADLISANIQLNDNLTVTNAATSSSGSLEISGIISESGGTRTLTKAGAGLLILSGNNTYTGSTTISAGKAVFSGSDNSAATGATAVSSGAIVQYNSAAAINGTARNVTVNAGGALIFDAAFGDTNIPTALSGRIVAASAGAIAADNYAATNFDFFSAGLTGASLGAVGNVTYTGTLTPNSAVWRLGGGGGTLTMSNVLDGDGYALTVSGAGTSKVVLANNNTYTGITTVGSGTLSVGTIASANTSSPIGAYPNPGAAGLVLSGGTWQYTGTTTSTDRGFTLSTANSTIDVNTAGTALTLGTSALGSFTLNVTGGTGSSLSLPTATLTGNPTLSPSTASLTIAAVTQSGGARALTKAGTGTLTLSGANTHTGGTSMTAGILNIGHASALGTGPFNISGGTIDNTSGSSLTLANINDQNWTGSFTFTGSNPLNVGNGRVALGAAATVTVTASTLTVGGPVVGTGSLTKAGNGALTLGGVNTFTGSTTINAGKIVMGNALALQNSAYVTTGSNGTTIGLDVNGNATPTLGGLSGAVNLAGAIIGYSGVTSLTLNPLSGSQTYTGVIADCNPGVTATSLAKTGSGTQILSGANSYTGATSISGGVLRINGNQSSATGAVSVSAGALGGTGTLGAGVTLSGTGGIDLRDGAIGNLTINGNLAINGAAGSNKFYFDLGTGGTTDGIVVNGNVTMPTANAAVIGFNQLNQSTGGRVAAGSYNLIQATGTMPSLSDFTLPTSVAFGSTFVLGISGSTLQVTTAQLPAGPAAAFWSGATDANWSTAGNWNSTVAGGALASGAPSYQSNVTFSTTTPAAGNLSNTLDADFDINSLTFNATTGGVTIGGSKMLVIEAANANGNTAGNGIIASAQTSGINTINANIGLAGSQSWNIGTGGTLTVGGNVTDFGGGFTLTKAGTGTLNLNGTTSMGSLVANAGTVGVGSTGVLSVGTGPGDNVYVGSVVSGTTAVTGTLDVSTSNSFTANVAGFYVGTDLGNAIATGTLKLGANNTITASLKVMMGGNDPDSDNASAHSATITTAAGGTTTINTPYMALGTSKGTGTFTLGTGATLNLGANTARTSLVISRSDTGNGYNRPGNGTMNLSAGVANLHLNSLVIGRKTVGGNSEGVYTGSGTLTLGTSASNHLDISGAGSVVAVGYTTIPGYAGTGTLTIGNLDATSAIESTDNSTAICLGTGASGNGTLNLNGGTLTITTTGSAIAGGGGTANLNLDGGVTLKAGAASTSWIQGLTNAKIKSGGVVFDTNSYDITVNQALLTDGTSLNGGLTKAGAGKLTLGGTNTYTGATTINAGTLALGAANVLADASNVSIGTATLDAATFADAVGNLAVTGTAAINLGAGAALAFADSHLVTWSGTLNLTGTFVSGSSLRFGTDANGLTPEQLASISAAGFSGFALNDQGYLTASGGATLDHFVISTITSPQTVGTPVTGITITAQDASNNTFTGFAGTVDFSGSAGITGTSGTFTNGQLTGLSVTPLNSGTGLTFVVTATGGSAFGTATFNVQTQYEAWAAGGAFTADSNNDGVPNGLAWLLGATSPSANATGLVPVASQEGGKLVMTFDCLKVAARGAASLKVQYSNDLGMGDPWTGHEVVVPDAGGTDPGTGIVFTVTPVNATLNHVKAAIPTTGKVFGRLSALP